MIMTMSTKIRGLGARLVKVGKRGITVLVLLDSAGWASARLGTERAPALQFLLQFVEESTMSSIEKFSSLFPFFFFTSVTFHHLDDLLRNSCRRNFGRSLALALS
jgi:hypothetical protein